MMDDTITTLAKAKPPLTVGVTEYRNQKILKFDNFDNEPGHEELAPADPAVKSREISDDDLKFALFGGGPVSDAQLEEVKRFARFIKERDAENQPSAADLDET